MTMTADDRLERLRAAIKRNREQQLQDMVVPPLEVLSRPPTVADVQAYPVYFIVGPGREIAEYIACEHGYMLTSSCPGCDAEED
jgi:hypothetical protein